MVNKINKSIHEKDKYKIALVHDWFLKDSIGGSEKVCKVLDNLLIKKYGIPDLFSLVENISNSDQKIFEDRRINTSFIQKLPFGKNNVQKYLPLIPFAVEQLNLDEYDIVFSSSHIASKGILTSPMQVHISYVHTPMRYAWDQMNTYLKSSTLAKLGLEIPIRYLMYKLREWDFISGYRPDYLIANSNFTAKRIKKYWGRNSEVIHPPVEIERFTFNKSREDFYLSVSRLVPNKRVDLLINAFNKLGLPLFIVGDGILKKSLIKKAMPNIKFFGNQSDKIVEDLMSRCRGFVCAGIEDFGIAPIEAMASGAPVIAIAKGGFLDSVKCITKSKNNQISTGLLFKNLNAKDIIDTLNWFEDNKLWKKFDSKELNEFSKRFDKENFSKKFEHSINKAIDNFQKS